MPLELTQHQGGQSIANDMFAGGASPHALPVARHIESPQLSPEAGHAKDAAGLEAERVLIDRLQCGVALFDEHSRLLLLNRHGSQVLSHSRVLQLRADGFHCRETLHREAFAKLLTRAAEGKPGALVIRGSGEPPVIVLAMPVRTGISPSGKQDSTPIEGASLQGKTTKTHFAVVFGTRAGTPTATLDTFGNLYTLTRAESRVLRELAQEQSPKEIARTIGVGVRTVRTQLSSIYGKVGVKTQRDLMTLLLQFPPFALY